MTPHGHPEWSGMVMRSLYRIGEMWGHVKPEVLSREYLPGLEGISAEGVDDAITALINSPSPLIKKPMPGQIRAAVPKARTSDTSGREPWWHTDGSKGGDWSSVSQRTKDGILRDIRKIQATEHPDALVTPQRRSFVEFLVSLGAQDPAAESAA